MSGLEGNDSETETETDIGSPVPNIRPLISLNSDEEVVLTNNTDLGPEMDTGSSDKDSGEEDMDAEVGPM
jgi:hypothetical protein